MTGYICENCQAPIDSDRVSRMTDGRVHCVDTKACEQRSSDATPVHLATEEFLPRCGGLTVMRDLTRDIGSVTCPSCLKVEEKAVEQRTGSTNAKVHAWKDAEAGHCEACGLTRAWAGPWFEYSRGPAYYGIISPTPPCDSAWPYASSNETRSAEDLPLPPDCLRCRGWQNEQHSKRRGCVEAPTELEALRKVAEATRASLRIWERATCEYEAVTSALAEYDAIRAGEDRRERAIPAVHPSHLKTAFDVLDDNLAELREAVRSLLAAEERGQGVPWREAIDRLAKLVGKEP